MGFSDQEEVACLDLALMRFDIDLEKLVAGFVIEFRRGP